MYSLGILLLLCHLSQGLPTPVDAAVVRIQQWVVLGEGHTVQRVLLNGVSLTNRSQEISSIIQTMSADSPLPSLSSVNRTTILRNHSVLRLRECILEGSQVHWTDRVLYDGRVYLTLDHRDTWTAQTPEALALKAFWEQDPECTKRQRIQLQEGCIKLMKELGLSEEQSVPGNSMTPFLIPAMAMLAFIGLVVIGMLISKKQGLRHPGGVIGSIIHYPVDMTEVPPENVGHGYQII